MWGEIEPQIKTQPRFRKKENADEAKQPEDETTDSLEGHFTLPIRPQQSQTHILVSWATWHHNSEPPKFRLNINKQALYFVLLLLLLTTMTLPIIQDESPNDSPCVMDMVEAVARGSSPVKSQQIGEPELSLTERRQELLRQYREKPLVFLERYHVCVNTTQPHG